MMEPSFESYLESIIERTLNKCFKEFLSNHIKKSDDDKLITTSEVCDLFYTTRQTIINKKKSGLINSSGKRGKEELFLFSECLKVFPLKKGNCKT